MSYLCVHGHIRPSCTLCSAIEEAVDEYMTTPEDAYFEDDWKYDHYLDLDERALREMEEE